MPIHKFETQNKPARIVNSIRDAPPPPEILADARQEVVHVEVPVKARPAKSTKVKPIEQKKETIKTQHPSVHGSLEIIEEEL